MSLSHSVCSQSGLPICTSFWAFFRAFKALRALKGPPIKFSHILMHRPYRDLQNLKFSCLYLFPFSHKVVYQKASGRGVGGGSGGGSGRIPHFNWSIYRGGNFFFFFFFFEPGVKLDEKSIENGLEGQKFLVVCLFWGGCHHPNKLSAEIQSSSANYIVIFIKIRFICLSPQILTSITSAAELSLVAFLKMFLCVTTCITVV